MKRKIVLMLLSLVAAVGLCFGLAACDDTPSQGESSQENPSQSGSSQDDPSQGGSSQDDPQESLPGDEHLLFEKNESGDAYTVTGLGEGCTHTDRHSRRP